MKIQITSSGGLDLGDFPARPTITETDAVMAYLTETEGVRWEAVKLSGAWVIRRDGQVVSGDGLRGQRRRRDFTAALADATGRSVAASVSF